MNNIKVIAKMLENLDTDNGDNWHKLQATFFLRLIKMNEKRWNQIINELALEAAVAESYDAGAMVNILYKRVLQEGFCTELLNSDKQNVAVHANELLHLSRVSGYRWSFAFRRHTRLCDSSRSKSLALKVFEHNQH